MSSRFVRLQVYINDVDAEIARGLLKENGILSRISKDDAGGMRPHLQLTQGVHLYVPFEQSSEAMEVLKLNNDLSQRTLETDGEPWQCKKCGEEIESQFTSCWSCGYELEESPEN